MKAPSYIRGTISTSGIVLLAFIIFISKDFGMTLAIVLLSLCALGLLASLVAQLKNALLSHSDRLYAKDFSLRFMATLMGFFLITGTGLYLYAFHVIHQEGFNGNPVELSNAEYLLRSLICSLDLFMLDIDSNVLDRLDSQAALKGWISIQAVLSFSCTVAMLVGLVYSRLNAYITLAYRTNVSDRHNHLYLFFGNNEPSCLLIKDITAQDSKAISIIIDEANVNEDDNDEWEGIIGLITHKQKVFKNARNVGAQVAIASKKLDDIEPEISSSPDFDAFAYLGIGKIKKLISRLADTDSPELHIFFMGEDEEENIRNIIALAKDRTISAVAADKRINHRIYCHARYSGPNRVIQDVALKKHLNLKIVDSSHIAVELLKLQPEYHPVRVVELSKDNPATVASPLSTLIIGFGEVGRDAFRFLYEFGSFTAESSTELDSRKSPFSCVVVDKDLVNIEGALKASMPSIFKSTQENSDLISFRPIDYNSEEFYSSVLNDEFMAGLNYVVISIGDNDGAIALAARIFDRARSIRTDLSNLRILVRCTDNKKVEGVQKIADHYNYGYGLAEANVPVIHIFGQPEKTYRFDLVVSDRLMNIGRIFHEQYRVLTGEGADWYQRRRELTQTGTPDIDKLQKLRRQESQDMANALHVGTKIYILKKALGEAVDWNSFYLRYFNSDETVKSSGRRTEIHYPELSERENRIILNLAMLEHLRWNAAHELLGYRLDDRSNGCDERTRQHNCLCAWHRLDEKSDRITEWECDYKKYDFCVVDTTLALVRDEILYP